MKILITGSQGQVAWDLLRVADSKKHEIFSFGRDTLDITDPLLVDQAIETIRPHLVMNVAAYTQVDKAEDEVERAFAVNHEGAKNLAIACEKARIPLLHVSTDYVFDGKQNHPYVETDEINPLGIYGKSKWEGEQAVRHNCERHIILRVSAVFGSHGQNFVKTMIRLARDKEILRVVSNQITCPTSAADIAKLLWDLSEKTQAQAAWGTYHFCGKTPISWYEFANIIIEQAKAYFPLRNQQIVPIPSSEYTTRAERPQYSVLDCHKLEKFFSVEQPSWELGLADVMQQLLKS